MLSRRTFLTTSGGVALGSFRCHHLPQQKGRPLVNDVQSRLNATSVERVVDVRSLSQLEATIRQAADSQSGVSVCGARHSMGGQQFLTDGILLDTRRLRRVLAFDAVHGTIEAEAGIQWPELLEYLLANQRESSRPWTFAQKQTGANRLCLGGALASNIHGRGLAMKPFVSDIESFKLMDASGTLRRCSRAENRELFRLAIGGYGLFGIVYAIELRLVPRIKLQRVVQMVDIDEVTTALARRIEEGFVYGDFQFAIDAGSDEFLRRGILSCYIPAAIDTPIPPRKKLPRRDWLALLKAAHTHPSRAFHEYARYYQATSGSVHWSDLLQFSGYVDDFHDHVDRSLGAKHRGSEIITELYVPRIRLTDFMAAAREDLRKNNVKVIYGTIRLIERDDESFLAWARESYACVIFNLHTDHTPQGIRHSADAFRRLIDLAAERDGSYYLTYHRFATRRQLDTCYPGFGNFLERKREFDPDNVFRSDWYEHYRRET